LVISHGVRHCSSEAHRSVVGHGFVPLHVSSCGSSQTPVVPDTMQRSAGLVTGQSLETSHALWHLPNAQMSGESQSLLIEQLPESSTPDELQLADVAAITAATRRSAARATARRTFGVDTIELAKRDAPTRQRRGLAFDAGTQDREARRLLRRSPRPSGTIRASMRAHCLPLLAKRWTRHVAL
jgi:hypothetical protein